MRGDGQRRSERIALGVAAAMHVALLLALHRVLTPSSRIAPGPAAEASALDVEVVVDPVPESASAKRLMASANANANEGSSSNGSRSAVISGRSAPATATTSGAVTGVAPSEGPTDSWSLPTGSVAASRVDLGLGAARYGSRAEAANEETDTSPNAAGGTAATNAVLAALDTRDVDLGLSHGSPLVTAVEEAVHAPDAPMFGVAVFDVTVLAGGATTVDLVDANEDGEGWSKLRGPIEARAAAKKVRLPENAYGIRVRVRVEAVERYADGTDVAKLNKAAAVESTAHKGTLIRSEAPPDPPYVALSHRGRICNVHAGIGVLGPYIGGGCSPENAAIPRRVVAARIVSETRL